MEKHDMIIQRGDPSQHRSQGIVERFNRTLADRLFSYQYHRELKSGKKCLDPNLKNEITRSILKINKRFIAHFNQ